MSKRAKEFIYGRYKEAVGKGDGGEGSSRSAPANRPKQMAIDFEAPRERSTSSNQTSGREHWEQSLRDAFFDEDGKDVGYPPIELKSRSLADGAHLHQACDGLGLLHEAAVTTVMVIGSARNIQGQQRSKELDLAAGWPTVPYVPDIDNEHEEGEDGVKMQAKRQAKSKMRMKAMMEITSRTENQRRDKNRNGT
jgi:hypothetical protein